jgi:hypothetical protein
MLTAQSVATTTAVYAPKNPNSSQAYDQEHVQQTITHTISWATGVTAGTVVIESADSGTYAGTWAPIATLVNNGGGTAYQDSVQHPGGFKAIRHRISVGVTGGASPSVTTRIYGVPS